MSVFVHFPSGRVLKSGSTSRDWRDKASLQSDLQQCRPRSSEESDNSDDEPKLNNYKEKTHRSDPRTKLPFSSAEEYRTSLGLQRPGSQLQTGTSSPCRKSSTSANSCRAEPGVPEGPHWRRTLRLCRNSCRRKRQALFNGFRFRSSYGRRRIGWNMRRVTWSWDEGRGFRCGETSVLLDHGEYARMLSLFRIPLRMITRLELDSST